MSPAKKVRLFQLALQVGGGPCFNANGIGWYLCILGSGSGKRVREVCDAVNGYMFAKDKYE